MTNQERLIRPIKLNQNLFEVVEAAVIAADERTEVEEHILGVIFLNATISTGCVTLCIIQIQKLTRREVNFSPKTVETLSQKCVRTKG